MTLLNKLIRGVAAVALTLAIGGASLAADAGYDTLVSNLDLTSEDARGEFFTVARPIFGRFSQAQVEALDVLLVAGSEAAGLRADEFAYMLATIVVETDRTMLPIVERGSRAYFNRYDIDHKPKKARELGNLSAGDGYLYRGRGFVQLTGRANYERMGDLLGIDLESNPDLALQPDVALSIMIIGMTRGSFTGRRLEHYFADALPRFVEARAIINGKDRAAEIAGYAEIFLDALLRD